MMLYEWFLRLRGFRYARRSQCWVSREGNLKIFGMSIPISMPLHKDGTTDFSLEDVARMAIRCVRCGSPILIYDEIMIYQVSDPDFVVPEGAFIYQKEPLQLVGCTSMDCAPQDIPEGSWMPHPTEIRGMVQLYPSSADVSDPDEDPVVVISDHSDTSDAGDGGGGDGGGGGD